MRHTGIQACVLVLAMTVGMAMAARIRPGGDPADERVIWADPFDNYSQWAYDNAEFWEGGPVPPGDPAGSYPAKSADGGGCGVSIQTTPTLHEMAREQWVSNDCGTITSPAGMIATPASFDAQYDPNCGGSGEFVTTRGMNAKANYTWGMGGSYVSMGLFSRNLLDRIEAIAEYRELGARNAINGTDENPLVVVFYLHDTGLSGNTQSLYDNSYVELSLHGDHAPTDYIWRGNPDNPEDPEFCPQGPYPVICQQAREVNDGNYESATDLQYINANCPPLEPPYDPQTGTGRTWKSIAFGFMAILDKNPCKLGISTSHRPTMNHFTVFDGNKWRELRNSRYRGLQGLPQAGGVTLSWPPEEYMSLDPDPALDCNNFSLSYGNNMVYIKIITDWILLYVDNNYDNPSKTNPPWHACVPRVYKGPFDTISWGVGPGCELDPVAYQCKEGGTPTQCLTYSQDEMGYYRTDMDSMSILDGELVWYEPPPPPEGACCYGNGECVVTDQATCEDPLGLNGRYDGHFTQCGDVPCCSTPFADADHDGDVDHEDFGIFQACVTGHGGGVPAGCECFDQHAGIDDPDVDEDDFAIFQLCSSGPDIPSNPACAD